MDVNAASFCFFRLSAAPPGSRCPTYTVPDVCSAAPHHPRISVLLSPSLPSQSRPTLPPRGRYARRAARSARENPLLRCTRVTPVHSFSPGADSHHSGHLVFTRRCSLERLKPSRSSKSNLPEVAGVCNESRPAKASMGSVKAWARLLRVDQMMHALRDERK